jgi:hypothetical protein
VHYLVIPLDAGAYDLPDHPRDVLYVDVLAELDVGDFDVMPEQRNASKAVRAPGFAQTEYVFKAGPRPRQGEAKQGIASP